MSLMVVVCLYLQIRVGPKSKLGQRKQNHDSSDLQTPVDATMVGRNSVALHQFTRLFLFHSILRKPGYCNDIRLSGSC